MLVMLLSGLLAYGGEMAVYGHDGRSGGMSNVVGGAILLASSLW